MVSVIIPTYNRANTLERAVRSVLNQTYQNIELIIVDDGSTDNTEEVVKKIADNRIIYLKYNTNRGSQTAMNLGIEMSQGELIAIQDSDDEWLNNKLEIQLNEIYSTKSDLVGCSYLLHTNKGNIEIPGRRIEDSQLAESLLYDNCIGTPTLLGKRECFINEKFDTTLPNFCDWELMIRMSRRYKIHFINTVLLNVYQQEDSLTRSFEKSIESVKLILKKYDYIYSINILAKQRLLAYINYWESVSQ